MVEGKDTLWVILQRRKLRKNFEFTEQYFKAQARIIQEFSELWEEDFKRKGPIAFIEETPFAWREGLDARAQRVFFGGIEITTAPTTDIQEGRDFEKLFGFDRIPRELRFRAEEQLEFIRPTPVLPKEPLHDLASEKIMVWALKKKLNPGKAAATAFLIWFGGTRVQFAEDFVRRVGLEPSFIRDSRYFHIEKDGRIYPRRNALVFLGGMEEVIFIEEKTGRLYRLLRSIRERFGAIPIPGETVFANGWERDIGDYPPPKEPQKHVFFVTQKECPYSREMMKWLDHKFADLVLARYGVAIHLANTLTEEMVDLLIDLFQIKQTPTLIAFDKELVEIDRISGMQTPIETDKWLMKIAKRY